MLDPCLREEYRVFKNILQPLCVKNSARLSTQTRFGTRMFNRINYSGTTFSREITPKSFTSPRAPFRGFTEETMIFHEISFAFTGSFLILVNIWAPRATILKSWTDSDFNYAWRKVALGAEYGHPERSSCQRWVDNDLLSHGRKVALGAQFTVR